MKTILLLVCLLFFATIPAICLGMGCTPKEPKEQPMVTAPEPTPPAKPEMAIIKPVVKPSIPMVIAIKKVGKGFSVKVNQAAKNAIKKGAEVRMQVGYCWYRGIPQSDGTILISPDWTPPNGRVTLGVAQGNTYFSSVLIQG